ncbi:MAG: hypothetical protein ACP5D2_04060 [Candidatus Nanoarchaeia archaeon]
MASRIWDIDDKSLGGFCGLIALLILSLLVRFNVIMNEAVIGFLYAPTKLGFAIYHDMARNNYWLGISLMFLCLVLTYYFIGVIIGYIIEKWK